MEHLKQHISILYMWKPFLWLFFFFLYCLKTLSFSLCHVSAISTWGWWFLFGKQQWSFEKIKKKPQTINQTKLISRSRKNSWKQTPNSSFIIVNMFNKRKENHRKKILESGPQTYTNILFWMISILHLLDSCYKIFKTLPTYKRVERLHSLFLKFNSL